MARRRLPPSRLPDLVEAATRVFIANGFRRTQMADVAAALGVAKGTLYLYVESKEALFDAAVRFADRPAGSLETPAELPLPTPPPGATLHSVEKRVATEGTLPRLSALLEQRRAGDARQELEAVVQELYDVLSAHRVGIKLIDRCAHDYPELADVWYRTGRGGAVALLGRFLADRMARGRLRRFDPPEVAARIVLELVSFWAVHRHWDPAPQAIDDVRAREAVVAFALAALLEE